MRIGISCNFIFQQSCDQCLPLRNSQKSVKLLEKLFLGVAQRTCPFFREIFKRRTRLNSMIDISFGRIVYISAGALVFTHQILLMFGFGLHLKIKLSSLVRFVKRKLHEKLASLLATTGLMRAAFLRKSLAKSFGFKERPSFMALINQTPEKKFYMIKCKSSRNTIT